MKENAIANGDTMRVDKKKVVSIRQQMALVVKM